MRTLRVRLFQGDLTSSPSLSQPCSISDPLIQQWGPINVFQGETNAMGTELSIQQTPLLESSLSRNQFYFQLADASDRLCSTGPFSNVQSHVRITLANVTTPTTVTPTTPNTTATNVTQPTPLSDVPTFTLSTQAIIGISIGGAVFLILLFLGYLLTKRKRIVQDDQPSSHQPSSRPMRSVIVQSIPFHYNSSDDTVHPPPKTFALSLPRFGWSSLKHTRQNSSSSDNLLIEQQRQETELVPKVRHSTSKNLLSSEEARIIGEAFRKELLDNTTPPTHIVTIENVVNPSQDPPIQSLEANSSSSSIS